LLEATSSTAEGEHKQESSKEDPSTEHPKRLMLALFFALFIGTIAITIAIQLSPQGLEIISLLYLVGAILAIVDVIQLGVIFLVLANCFRFMNAVVRDKAYPKRLMLALLMAGILLLGLLALEALTLTAVAADSAGEHRNPWLIYFATFGQVDRVVVSFLLAVLIGYYCLIICLGAKLDSQTIYLHWSRLKSCLGFSFGLKLGMIVLLAVFNWGLQGGLTAPMLVSVFLVSLLLLTFFLACTAAFFLAVPIL
jgi:hypothetical protein